MKRLSGYGNGDAARLQVTQHRRIDDAIERAVQFHLGDATDLRTIELPERVGSLISLHRSGHGSCYQPDAASDAAARTPSQNGAYLTGGVDRWMPKTEDQAPPSRGTT